MQEPTIFTRIINGSIPAHKIYEDDKTLAFLDIMPANQGHVLVVPKLQVEFIWDLPEDDYTAVMATVRKVGLRIQEILKPPYVGQLVVGTDVPHAHVHVVPFAQSAEIKNALGSNRDQAEEAELSAMAEKLRF